jgi:hypothetical protein
VRTEAEWTPQEIEVLLDKIILPDFACFQSYMVSLAERKQAR